MKREENCNCGKKKRSTCKSGVLTFARLFTDVNTSRDQSVQVSFAWIGTPVFLCRGLSSILENLTSTECIVLNPPQVPLLDREWHRLPNRIHCGSLPLGFNKRRVPNLHLNTSDVDLQVKSGFLHCKLSSSVQAYSVRIPAVLVKALKTDKNTVFAHFIYPRKDLKPVLSCLNGFLMVWRGLMSMQ